MGYDLEAAIARPELLTDLVDSPAAVVVPLAQGLGLLPVTRPLREALHDRDDRDHLGFPWLTRALADRLADRSVAGPVAYVEAEYTGGHGGQRAVVWRGRTVTFGPVADDDADNRGPISQALALLGVHADGHTDEFEAAGLRRHRHTRDWAGPTPFHPVSRQRANDLTREAGAEIGPGHALFGAELTATAECWCGDVLFRLMDGWATVRLTGSGRREAPPTPEWDVETDMVLADALELHEH